MADLRGRQAGLAAGLWLLAAGAAAVDSQRSITQYSLNSWREHDGFVSASVRAIAQTPDGYLWLGTDGGLLRFDGVRFAPFSSFNTPQLDATYVSRLMVDRRGRLWIGMNGLTCVADGVFRRGPCDPLRPGETLMPNTWDAIVEDRDGAVWLGDETGVFRVADGRVTHYTAAHGLVGSAVFAIAQDRAGTLWIGTNEGLQRFTGERFELHAAAAQAGVATVGALCPAANGGLWIGAVDRVYRLEQGQPTPVVTVPARAGVVPTIATLHEDRAGNLWVGAFEGGLGRLRAGALETLSVEDGLSSRSAIALFEDREGSLWIGTEDGGLNRLKEGQFVSFLTQDGLPHNTVLSVRESRDGTLWIGTVAGLARLQDGAMKTYGTRDGLPNDHINSLLEDRAGTLWIGTNEGLVHLEAGRFETHTARGGRYTNQIRTVAEGPDGSLWMVLNAPGVYRFKDGRFVHYTTKDGLANDYVRIVHRDRRGTMWFTTRGGVNRFEDERFALLTTNDGLAGNVTTGLHEGDDGSLWLGSQDGLSWIKDGRIRAFTGQQAEFLAQIDQILEDDEGHLWLGTASGIFEVAKADLLAFSEGQATSIPWTRYGLAQGLSTVQASTSRNWPPAWKGRDGRLWFATVKGLAMRDPRHVNLNRLAPEVRVEALRAGGASLETRTALQLAPHQRSFELHYTALSLLEPDKVRFRYRLEGFDADWIDAGARRVAYYTHVPPGHYRFRVIACNNSGVWNEAGATLALSVAPRLHETSWFYALLGVVGLFAARGAHELRVRRLKAREKDLAAKVEAALAEVKTLSGLLPICASCKKIRDDKGYWNQIETYIQQHSDTDFSHGICPDCTRRLYPEFHARSAQP